MRLLCKIGFHSWDYTNTSEYDELGITTNPITRECYYCSYTQELEKYCLGLNPPEYIIFWSHNIKTVKQEIIMNTKLVQPIELKNIKTRIKSILNNVDFQQDLRYDISAQRRLSMIQGLIEATHYTNYVGTKEYSLLFNACENVMMNLEVPKNIFLIHDFCSK